MGVVSCISTALHTSMCVLLCPGTCCTCDCLSNSFFAQSSFQADGYFGYDFAVLNFDPETSDLDGLVVGCPLCDRERGRVYVYTHTGDVSNPVSHTHTHTHTHTQAPTQLVF